MKTWVKLYTEIIEDPDQGSLSLAERGIWSLFLALCGRIDDRDADGNETGKLDTPERIAWYLRCGVAEIENALTAFAERGMIEDRAGVIYLPHFAARQQHKPSDEPARVRERVQRYREMKRLCNADVTPLKHPVTRSDTDTDTDTESSSESERAPAARADDDDDDDGFAAQFAVVVRDWEKLNPRRQISGLDAEFLHEMAQNYGCNSVSQAIRSANKYGATSLAYIEQVLRNGHSPPSRASPPLTLPPEPPGLVWDGDRFMAQQRTAQQHADDQSNPIRPASP